MKDRTFYREAFCELVQKAVELHWLEPVPPDSTKEILEVPVEIQGTTIWLIHEVSEDTFTTRVAIAGRANALPSEALARILQANWTLACMHMPVIGLNTEKDQLVYSLRQVISSADPAVLVTTIEHLWKISKRLQHVEGMVAIEEEQ